MPVLQALALGCFFSYAVLCNRGSGKSVAKLICASRLCAMVVRVNHTICYCDAEWSDALCNAFVMHIAPYNFMQGI